jgi:hypothetical protein
MPPTNTRNNTKYLRWKKNNKKYLRWKKNKGKYIELNPCGIISSFVRTNKKTYKVRYIRALIKSGNLDALQYIHKYHTNIFNNIEYLRVSAIHNKLYIAKWLVSIGCPFNDEDCISRCAAMYADAKFFEFIHKLGCIISEQCYDYAAGCGNLSVLKYMRSVRILEGWVSFNEILENADHYNVIEWCFENGVKPDNDFINTIVIFCFNADFSDTVAIIELARKYNAEWSCETSFTAAKQGNLPLLQWLYKNKCPVDVLGICEAIRNGSITIDLTLFS